MPFVQVHLHIPTWVAVAIFVVVLVCGVGHVLWDVYQGQAILDQLDQATDDADKAVRGVQAITEHLDGTEPPATGRHASRRG